MKKRDEGKFVFICISIAMVMLAGLYIDSIDDTAVKHDAGISAYSVEILPKEEEKKEEKIELTLDGEVYTTKSGSRFHIKNDCGSMNPDNANKITVKDALDKGLSPCKICLKNVKFS